MSCNSSTGKAETSRLLKVIGQTNSLAKLRSFREGLCLQIEMSRVINKDILGSLQSHAYMCMCRHIHHTNKYMYHMHMHEIDHSYVPNNMVPSELPSDTEGSTSNVAVD